MIKINHIAVYTPDVLTQADEVFADFTQMKI